MVFDPKTVNDRPVPFAVKENLKALVFDPKTVDCGCRSLGAAC